MLERGYEVCHSTIIRWVYEYSPLIAQKVKKHLKLTNDSWRVDETYIKIKGEWKYLYRAMDSDGHTIDFLLTSKQGKKAAKRFFNKTFNSTKGIISGIETMNILRKGQVDGLDRNALLEYKFVGFSSHLISRV